MSNSQTGCTFIDWSIHFLSGQTQYYKFPEQEYINLSANPLTGLTAHGHEKNHPIDFANVKNIVEHFKTLTGLFSFYPITGPLASLAEEKNINIHTASQETIWKLFALKAQEYNRMIEYCHNQNVKIVYVAGHPDLIFYHTLHISRASLTPSLVSEEYQLVDITTAQLQSDQVFFNFNNKNFDDHTWDQREKFALNRRPWDPRPLTLRQPLALKYPHFWCKDQEFFYNGVNTIKNIMTYLELPIDYQKFKEWRSIYVQWQQTQLDLMKFDFTVEHIIESTVNNWYYEFGNLTFEQEVVIQHALIYQYGLNLKTWGLEKFPTNAQDLHKLLEPNCHPLTDY